MRVLGTGSRGFPETDEGREFIADMVARVLLNHRKENDRIWQLIVGDCPSGADKLLLEHWKELGQPYQVLTVDWEAPCRRTCTPGHRRWNKARMTNYCPAAGPYRNQLMVDLDPDLCIAFPYTGESRGTHDCMRRAKKAGIPVIVCDYDTERLRVF